MGDSHFARCLQGGGVLVQGGSVTFDSCTITGNTATYVHAHPQNFPSPRWDFYMFCACACRAVVSLSLEAQWPSHRAPSLAIQLLMCVLTLKSSHRPDGIFTCFARVLAGRRCVHQQWHGELLIVHHHGQHSWLCACSRSKVPILTLMGKCLVDMSISILIFDDGAALIYQPGVRAICT